jgi:nucleoside-diphosphate-sugar epimerase
MAKNNRYIELQSDGSPLRDFISLNLIGSFVKKLIKTENKKNEIINLCSGKTLSILEIAKQVATNPFFKESIPLAKKKPLKKKNITFKYDNFKMKKYLKNININYKKDICDFLSKI